MRSAARFEGLREIRGARGPNRHGSFSLEQRSQPVYSVFITHRSFYEWQRLQADRIFPERLRDPPIGEENEAEAEVVAEVVRRSMLKKKRYRILQVNHFEIRAAWVLVTSKLPFLTFCRRQSQCNTLRIHKKPGLSDGKNRNGETYLRQKGSIA